MHQFYVSILQELVTELTGQTFFQFHDDQRDKLHFDKLKRSVLYELCELEKDLEKIYEKTANITKQKQ